MNRKSINRFFATLMTVIMFFCCSDVSVIADTLTLPSSLTKIGEEAFYGVRALDKVVVPSGTKFINARAFADCKISRITLPESVTYISPTAFNGNMGMIVEAKENSYAYNWAIDHGFTVDIGSVSKLKAAVQKHKVILTWNAGRSYDGYRISKKEDGVNIELGYAESNYYEIENVAKGKYTYCVEPYADIRGTTQYGQAKTVAATVQDVPVEEITLSSTYLDLEIGEQVKLSAAVEPADADNKALKWTSSNTGVATVSGGTIKAVSGGSATITASAKDGSGIKAICIVDVSAEAPTLTVTHPTIGDVLNAGEIEMFNGAAHQTWTVNSNYPVRVETVGDWFDDRGNNSFEAGQNTYIIYMADGAPAGTKRTGKVRFFINNSLFVEVKIFQDGGTPEPVVIDPTISVNHPFLGDIFSAGTIEMYNGAAHQTWTITSNCDWTISKTGTWYTIDNNITSGHAGTTTMVIRMTDGAPAGTTRNGSITFNANGKAYRTVNFRQTGESKSLTVSHAALGDVLAASPIEYHNGSAVQNWTIVSNADWTIKTSGSWFTVDKTSGTANTSSNPTTNLKITVKSGVSAGSYREGSISFYFGSSLYKKVTIYQDGGEEEIDTDPAYSISVVHPFIGSVSDAGEAYLTNSSGQSQTWTVFANFDWTIQTSGDSWFKVDKTSGTGGEKTTLKITTTSYAPSGYNSGSISFYRNSSRKLTIDLYQGEGYSATEHGDSFSVSHPLLGDVLEQDTIYLHNGSGTDMNWTIMSNVSWSLSSSGSWFTVTPTSGAANTSSSQSTNVRIRTTSYAPTGTTNEGYIQFSYSINGRSRTKTVYIAQYGGPAEPEDPVYGNKLTASHLYLGDVFAASPIEMHNATPTEQNWSISSNKAWTITTSGNWFEVNRTSGPANTESSPTTNLKITIKDWARPGTKNSGTITFYINGTKYRTVSIYQDGGQSADPSMTIGSSEFGDVLTLDTIQFEYKKAAHNFTVKANRAWSVSKTGSWFSITPASGEADTLATFKVTVSTLPAKGQELTGSLTFKVSGTTVKTVNLKIRNPETAVVNPTDDKLPAPANVTVTVKSRTSAQLQWNAVTGAKGYNVYRSKRPSAGYSKINASLITQRTYTDSGMTDGTEYYYTVEAVNSSGTPGNASIPVGPISYDQAWATGISESPVIMPYTGASKSITVAKHGTHDFTVTNLQYNSSGDECDGNVTEDDNRKSKWFTCTKSGNTLQLKAGKNYAAKQRKAIVTLTCSCGAKHEFIVNQQAGEASPASVSMKLDGYNGFTVNSTEMGSQAENHLDYVLAPSDTLTVSATGGSNTRRLTVKILDPGNKTVKSESFTNSGNNGTSGTISYKLPSSASGTYTIRVYAANSTVAGSDSQYIDAAAQIYVGKTTSLNKTLDVYRYTQGDSKWGSVYINDNAATKQTIAVKGCAVTSVAMTERYRKNDTSVTPLSIKKNYSFDGNSIYWSNSSANWGSYSGPSSGGSGKPSLTNAQVMQQCYNNINAGKPSVIGLNTGSTGKGNLHYVVVYGYSNLDPNNMKLVNFLVKDPAGSNRENLQVVAKEYYFRQVYTYSGAAQVNGTAAISQYITFNEYQSINNEWLGSPFIAKGAEVTSDTNDGEIADRTGYVLQGGDTINIPFSTDTSAAKVSVLLCSMDQGTTYVSKEKTSFTTQDGKKIGNFKITVPDTLTTGTYLFILTSQKSISGNPDVRARVKVKISGLPAPKPTKAQVLAGVRAHFKDNTKLNTAVKIAEALYADYDPAFIAGVLGNMQYEADVGQFEYIGSVKVGQNGTERANWLENNYSYKNTYSGKFIYNGFSLSAVKQMSSAMKTWEQNYNKTNGTNYDALYGMGFSQWTSFNRNITVIDRYIAKANERDTITKDEALAVEVQWLKEELDGGYHTLYTSWLNGYSDRTDGAYCAGVMYCQQFEKPGGTNYAKVGSKMLTEHDIDKKRGNNAQSIYDKMTGN